MVQEAFFVEHVELDTCHTLSQSSDWCHVEFAWLKVVWVCRRC